VLAAIAGRQQRSGPLGAGWGVAAGRAYILFRLLQDAFAAPAPPALRAALYELAGQLPGLRLDGRLTDHAGRVGEGVSVVLRAVRFRIIISPATGELLQADRFLIRPSDQLGPGIPVGLYSRATFLATAVVPRDR
jgi:hypothetical protein